jgi:hypothetical protein
LFVVTPQIPLTAPPLLINNPAEARQIIAKSNVYSIRSCPLSSLQKLLRRMEFLVPESQYDLPFQFCAKGPAPDNGPFVDT